MLQLPHSGPTRRSFTKAQIADMSRGAKVKIRVKKRAADPTLKHVNDLYAARATFIKTRTALIAFIKASEPGACRRAEVFLSPGVLLAVALSVEDRCFGEAGHIDRWAKEHRVHYRAIIRGRPKGNARLVSKATAKKYLAEIDELIPRLKRALRNAQAAKRMHWRATGYDKVLAVDQRAQKKFLKLRNSLQHVNPKSVAGACALIGVIEKFADISQSQQSYCLLHPHQQKNIARNALAALQRLAPSQ